MLRRLFFLLPDNLSALRLVVDVRDAGVPSNHIHATARDHNALRDLPPATARQKHDAIWRIDQATWAASLAVFAMSLVGLAVAWNYESMFGASIGLVMAIVSAVAGMCFAIRFPDTHVGDFHEALRHGEILLMIDVPRRLVAHVNNLVYRRYPEATPGGTGWTPGVFGM